MTGKDDMRAQLIAGRIGDFDHMSSSHLLAEAERDDEIARMCGPFDPAYRLMSQRATDLFEAA
jgi:hypothetical protein